MKAGTIGVVSGELARYSTFPRTLVRMDRPDGTMLDWAMSIDIASARNILIRRFLETPGEWIWFVDDDMVFDPDILFRLHATGAHIVQPTVLMRTAPHYPTMYRGPHPVTNLYQPRVLANNMARLIAVDACGTGGMFLKRDVLEAMADPWFEIGKVKSDSLGEDLYFCQKALAAGFQPHVATDIYMGHLTPVEIWPFKDNDTWMTEIRFGSHRSLLVEPATGPTPSPSSD